MPTEVIGLGLVLGLTVTVRFRVGGRDVYSSGVDAVCAVAII